MIYRVEEFAARPFVELFECAIEPVLVDAGSTVLAAFATEHAVNTFANLPFREGEDVFVWFARFVDRDAFERFRTWSEAADRVRPMQVLVLAPTALSAVR